MLRMLAGLGLVVERGAADAGLRLLVQHGAANAHDWLGACGEAWGS